MIICMGFSLKSNTLSHSKYFPLQFIFSCFPQRHRMMLYPFLLYLCNFILTLFQIRENIFRSK